MKYRKTIRITTTGMPSHIQNPPTIFLFFNRYVGGTRDEVTIALIVCNGPMVSKLKLKTNLHFFHQIDHCII